MTSCSTAIEYRRLRPPTEDRTALVVPPFAEGGELLDENLRLGAQQDCDIQGRSLAELSRQARRALLRDARRWVAGYGGALPEARSDPTDRVEAAEEGLRPGGPGPHECGHHERGHYERPILLAGHQPELFHPGVWLKNFALGALARRHGAVGVNLLIDSDTVRTTAASVPGGSPSDPRVEAILFDLPEPRVPYELRRIADPELFAGFGRRAAEQIAPLVGDPLIEAYWPLVEQRMRETDNLGACLAQSRHQIETQWGSRTLEVPQSVVCRSEPFCWFVAHLLARLPELWTTYNEAVRAYRRAHRTRSVAHPVPDLGVEGDWFEAPLWVYSADDPRRRPLYARRRGGEIVLGDGSGLEVELPLTAEGDGGRAVERLAGLCRRGVMIRSRAVITTLWARLALGDLFLHGIGGAKYDQVTDVLIERFLGLRPRGFMVLSATLRLPIARQSGPITRQSDPVEDSRAIAEQLRRLEHNPERFIETADGNRTAGAGDPRELIAEKARWVQMPRTSQNARLRCRTIRQINRALHPWVVARRRELLRMQQQAARVLRADRVLDSRQYAFCLYPEATFRGFLCGLLPKTV